jgi:hypothetical protein
MAQRQGHVPVGHQGWGRHQTQSIQVGDALEKLEVARGAGKLSLANRDEAR